MIIGFIFSSLLYDVLVFGGFLLVAALVVNRRAVGRVYKAAQAQLGEVGRAASNADPVAAYREAIDNAVDTLARDREVAFKSAGNLQSLQRQVTNGRTEVTRLENRIKSKLADDPNNPAVKQYALQLAEVENNLKVNEEQLNRQKEIHDNYLKQVERNERYIKETRRKAESLGLRLEQSEREKQMQAFSLDNRNGGFKISDLSAAEQKILERIDANVGASEVARDLSREGLAEIEDEERERAAQADSILERFRTKA